MIKDYVKYIKTDQIAGKTHIKVSIYYSKGGMDLATYKTVERGFYIRVRYVEIKGELELYCYGDDITQFIKRANKYTEKQFLEAKEEGLKMEAALLEKLQERFAA